MLIYKFQLMEYKGIFGYTFYASRTSRYVYKNFLELENLSKLIYNFKRYGRNEQEMETLIWTMKEHFSCSDIIVVPSSKIDKENVFQALYGTKLIRKIGIPSRKYDREKAIQLDYSSSMEVKKELIEGKRILLVDDICTTGKTISECLSLLKDYEVIPFVLAFSNTLMDKVTKKEYIYIYENIGRKVEIPSEIGFTKDLTNITRNMLESLK